MNNYSLFCTARNSDLNGIVVSMKQMEDRFNKKFHYDYIFLNEQPFEQNFKEWVEPFLFVKFWLIAALLLVECQNLQIPKCSLVSYQMSIGYNQPG